MGIEIETDDRFQLGRGDAERDVERSLAVLRTASGQTLHEAMRAYQKWVGVEYLDIDRTLTANGKKKVDQIRTLTTYLQDADLGSLDYSACDSLFGVFRRRPTSERYSRPMSAKSCSNYLGELGRFFNWLHRSSDFRWRKPEDFDAIKRTPMQIDDDATKASKDIPTWTIKEATTLYKYATPIERVFFLLGLNCAYGADQSGRLRASEVIFASDTRKHSRIKRIRFKRMVPSRHVLWKATEQGLKWALERRSNAAPDGPLLVNSKGKAYFRKTTAGNQSQAIPRLWNCLLDRVQKDHPEFRRLPFNTLRDTSSTWIRRLAGAETASLHLAHRHQSDDENLVRYTNPARKKHSRAVLKLEKKLQKVFAAVADPFPVSQPKLAKPGGANLSLGKIEKIRRMRLQGYKIQHIAKEIGVSRQTVWRHACEK
jgi:predicted DNA-binding protein (UPF0251 family)